MDVVSKMNSTAAAAAAGGTKPTPPELEQKESRQFKSKAPKRGQKGHDPAMEGLDDAAVVCPWEEYGDVELSELAQFGTV
uniref:3',5'-cyclic-GMP phosphodiesterase n=1 Tax=Poecilia latipinna TaxID=48699 RepID=A0A3B3V8Q4_9TELE